MHSYDLRTPIELRPALKAPVRLTQHEAAVWYRLSAHQGEVVSGQDLLWIGWGPDYNWDDPDPYFRSLNRHHVHLVIYWLRRLLDARADGWRIESARGDGYRLVKG